MFMKWLLSIIVVILLALGISCQISQPVLPQPVFSQSVLSQYCKSDNMSFILIDNPSARDISYTELLAFLDTFKPEMLPGKTCGHYAEELHNYAESQGIRCAIVIASRVLKYQDDDFIDTHAFNGFRTDGFMTYVDARKGIIAIAVKDSNGLKFVKDWGDQVSTQRIGQEKDFLIFWEGEK